MIVPDVPTPDHQATDAYDKLPEYVRCQFGRTEWLWLTDTEKANLESSITEPDA